MLLLPVIANVTLTELCLSLTVLRCNSQHGTPHSACTEVSLHHRNKSHLIFNMLPDSVSQFLRVYVPTEWEYTHKYRGQDNVHVVLLPPCFEADILLSVTVLWTDGRLAGQSLSQHTLKHRDYRCLLLYLGFQESNSEKLSLQAVSLLSHLPRLLKNRSHSIASLKPVTTLFQPPSNGVTGASHNAW